MIKKDYIVPKAKLVYVPESILAESKTPDFDDGYQGDGPGVTGGDDSGEVTEDWEIE